MRNAYAREIVPIRMARCIMLGSMSTELQRQCEAMNSMQIWEHLIGLYEGQAVNEQYKVSSDLFSCRMKESETVEAHGVRMISYLARLSDLGAEIPRAQAVKGEWHLLLLL